MLFFFGLILAGCCCAWAGAAADGKGHDSVGWCLAGLFLGPFALLAVCALPDLKQRRILRLMAEHQGVDFSTQEKPKQKPCDLYPELN